MINGIMSRAEVEERLPNTYNVTPFPRQRGLTGEPPARTAPAPAQHVPEDAGVRAPHTSGSGDLALPAAVYVISTVMTVLGTLAVSDSLDAAVWTAAGALSGAAALAFILICCAVGDALARVVAEDAP